MTVNTSNYIQAFLPNSIDFTDDTKLLPDQLTTVYSLIVTAVNLRQIGFYLTEEQLSGQQVYTPGNPQRNRFAFRKTFECGTLPNTASISIAHGIDFTNTDLEFLNIYGASTQPTVGAIPLPYVQATPQVQLDLTATNIVITTFGNYTAYTKTLVTIEYLKNA